MELYCSYFRGLSPQHNSIFFFTMAQQPPPHPNGPRPPHYRGFMITLRHTTLGRTPLDEWSARRKDLYLTTHNTHKRQIFMPPAAFEPIFPASERTRTHALDRAATGIGKIQANVINTTLHFGNIYKIKCIVNTLNQACRILYVVRGFFSKTWCACEQH